MNILVTGAWAQGKEATEKLNALGHKAVFMQNEKDELPCKSAEIDAVICNGLFLHHSIDDFKSLRYIQLTSAGYDRVPMEKVREKNIKIFNAGGVYSIPMAEYAVGAVLQMLKKFSFFAENQKKHQWVKNRELVELGGKTVCIFGCGNVGSECAKRFSAFGCRVLGVDVFEAEKEYFEKIVLLENSKDILPVADVVVLTMPLTEETRHSINKSVFSLMKKGAIVVNIARGALIDTEDLITALKTSLGGAVLDVFEDEPLDENSPLWDFENVIITPHNSFVSDGNNKRLWDLIFHNLSVE